MAIPPDPVEANVPPPKSSARLVERRHLVFFEYGPHKTIRVVDGPMSGTFRVSDQATIDALREAFERTGWEVEDRVGT